MSKRAPRSKAKPAAPAPRGPRTFSQLWEGFVFAPRDPRLASVLRIAFGVLVLVNVICLGIDLDFWFSDAGVTPVAVARLEMKDGATMILAHLPLHVCYAIFVAQTVLLIVGVGSRVQAASVFVWLVAFQHRNYSIVDGEDTVMRLFAFYLALTPCGWAYSVDAWWRRRRGKVPATPPIPWGLRLFQLQMSVIYLSSAFEKSSGSDWISGKAMYFVARLDDTFGKVPIPHALFEHLWLVKLMTWSVLALEWLLPIALWMKRFRRSAVIVGLVFHLAIEATMHLFLFHWLMMLGLVAFLEFDELPVIGKRASR